MTEARRLRAGLYLRVSTRKQEDGFSPQDQAEKLTDLADRGNWDAIIFDEDLGRSGETLDDRPGMQRLLRAVDDGLLDLVAVVDESRLARDELVGAVIRNRLKRAGVRLVTIAGERNLNDPSDNFVANILGAAAAFEQDQRTAKTMAGLRRAVQQGYWPGGPPPFDFTTVDADRGHKRLALHPTEADTLRAAVSLIVDEGLSTWEAAQRLNALGLLPRSAGRWSHLTVRRTLLAEYLSGHWTYARRGRFTSPGSTPIEVVIPALIDPDRHTALRAALARTSSGTPRRYGIYPLSGRLYGPCGNPFHGVHQTGRKRQYRCKTRKPETPQQCECRRLLADDVEFVVWEAVCDLLSHPDRLMAMASDFLGLRASQVTVEADQVGQIDRRLLAIERSLAERVGAYLREGVDPKAVKAATAELEAERDALLAHRDRLEAWRSQTAATSDRVRRLWDLAEEAHRLRLPSMTPAEQARLLSLLDVRVTVLDFGGDGPPRLRIEGAVYEGVFETGEGGDRDLSDEALRRSTCCRP